MSDPLREDQLAEIKAALFAGEKIVAIRLYREFSTAGLMEAKNAVEKLDGELRAAFPDRFTKQPRAKGCSGMVLAVGIALASIVLWRIRKF